LRSPATPRQSPTSGIANRRVVPRCAGRRDRAESIAVRRDHRLSAAMRITIHDYTPEWVTRYGAERDRLQPLLPSGAMVEHIGSTAVPGLAAKDIVDLMIGLPNFDTQAGDIVSRIVELGFVYLPKYEDVMPFRRFFYRSENEQRQSQIHMVGTGVPFWIDTLLFRDHLRENPAGRAAYEALKRSLAAREWQGFNDYTEEKSDFIRAALAEARATLRRNERTSPT
jgi:GrpB-like predicted nucleotidyltransferase (UPF0157 family)